MCGRTRSVIPAAYICHTSQLSRHTPRLCNLYYWIFPEQPPVVAVALQLDNKLHTNDCKAHLNLLQHHAGVCIRNTSKGKFTQYLYSIKLE